MGTRQSSRRAARLSWGVLNADNWNVGLSAAAGRTMETMGNRILDGDPGQTTLAALDATWLVNAFEHRFEADIGKLRDEKAWAVFYRLGWVLDGEARWKAEAQPQYLSLAEDGAFGFSLCLSWLATADLTIRAQYDYNDAGEDHRVLVQLYYYKQVL